MSSEIAIQHGLTLEEYERIVSLLQREPNLIEIGIFSAMWSEHCSYKSTKAHLKKMPTKAPWVICGPGEGAGVIDIGDGIAAVFKMESHNHPSYIEPFQGAATGVGGILRDIFTMGARPIANLNSLRFGETSHLKTKRLVNGVVKGISFYGNCVGVPMLGGETSFHESYNGNILVNAMTVGIADKNKIFYSKGSEVGAKVFYAGSKTGRDGIHGASMSSAEFSEDSENKKPTVQVGDPFLEKLLMEACLELMQKDCITSLQDMGAAGLTCSSAEMASKSGNGMFLDLNKVPIRSNNMTAYEMMLSESQERMLMTIMPGKEAIALDVFAKWEVDCVEVGHITNDGMLTVSFKGKIVAQVPASILADEAPVYERPYKKQKSVDPFSYKDIDKEEKDLEWVVHAILSSSTVSSKEDLYCQYDRTVRGGTILNSGNNCGLVKVSGLNKAIACTSVCNPKYVYANPYMGAMQAVAETYRNISSCGATPLAITNCLNFGSPQNPEIMGQLVSCIEGISAACEGLNYPVVSGNVSLYNETDGKAIVPTPTIGGVGVLNNLENACSNALELPGLELFVVGETFGHIGQSVYLQEVYSLQKGNCPNVDLQLELKNASFIRHCISCGTLSACQDVGVGGIFISLFRMITAKASMPFSEIFGANVSVLSKLPTSIYMFAEDQARYIVAIEKSKLTQFEKMAKDTGVYVERLGSTTGSSVEVDESEKLTKPVQISISHQKLSCSLSVNSLLNSFKSGLRNVLSNN